MLTAVKSATRVAESQQRQHRQSLIEIVAEAIYQASVRRVLRGINGQTQFCA